MALRITVLGNGRGMLDWLAVRKKPMEVSITDGSHERKIWSIEEK
jgi:hypothetical protein